MKRSVAVILCAALLAVGVIVPLGLQGAPAPEGAVQIEAPAEEPAASPGDGVDPAQGPVERPDEAVVSEVVEDPSGSNYVQGIVLVGLEDGVTADQLNERLASLDYIATKSISDDDIAFGYVPLELADGIDVKSAEARILEEDLVSAAQPNYVYHLLDDGAAVSRLSAGVVAQAMPIDDALKNRQWALEAVHAYDAWDYATVNGAVTVAVLDNGCLTTHEDLKNNIVATYNAVNGGKNVAPSFDGHGTHVCGIVAAEANNGKGVAGTSYNAGVLPVQVFEWCEDENGELFSGASSLSLCKAYEFITERAGAYNIKVANMSLGGYQLETDEQDDALIDAVDVAHDAGILTVCAAGNDADEYRGAYQNFPCDWLNNALGVIAVQNTTPLTRVNWSNYNKKDQDTKNISAPGTAMLSTYSSSDSSYQSLDGTSMASPCVAGIAALLFAVDPGLTVDDARQILLDTAQDINTGKNLSDDSTFDYETGYGLVDAEAAVKEAAKSATSKQSLRGVTVALSQSRYTYNGTAWRPGVSVSLDNVPLADGKDYEVVYSGNTNAGTAKVTVTGKGNYTGTVTKSFKIVAKPVTPTVTLAATNYVYNGAAKKPGVTVRVGGKKLATSGYTATYASGRKAVGKYAVKVTLKGNYSGAKTVYFKINPNKTTLSSVSVSGRILTAKWKKQATQTSGYQVQWSLKSDFSSGNGHAFITKNSTLSKKTPALKAKKKYYVRVRTYKTVSGTKYYSAWSNVRNATTKS